MTTAHFAAGWKRNFSLLRQLLYHAKYLLSSVFRKIFFIFLLQAHIFEKPLYSKDFSDQHFHYDIYFWTKAPKKTTTKPIKNLPLIFLHEKFDEKSYKMDIYKTLPGVYNIIPDKNTDPRRLLIPAQLAGFWRNINLMISLRT